jgi:molybdate transport system ATP-binding protein
VAEAGLVLSARQSGPIPLDAELSCAPGEVLALIGPSGSGKSTLLRTIAGVYTPAQGRVSVGGEVWLDRARGVDAPPHRRRVGLVFQSYALFPHMTALQNVTAAMGHLPRAKRDARGGELLALVHLSGLEGRRPAELSGGQQQRVAVARALARDPAVLLLDEPFSAVDKATRQRLQAELGDLRATLAMPVVLVTHDFDEAARVADRISLLDRGAIIQSGAPRDILARPRSVAAARLVDMRNVFEGRVIRHEPERTIIAWAGREIEAAAAPAFAPGTAVAWAIPATQVILSRTDVAAPAITRNLLEATIRDLAYLSESVSVQVRVEGAGGPTLSMTLPAHYARRTGLQKGSAVTLALVPDGIHLMPHPADGP